MRIRAKIAVPLFIGSAVFGMAAVYAGEQKPDNTKLVAAIPFSGVSKKDIALVEDEVNKITEEQLGVTVEFAATESYTYHLYMMVSGE